MSIRVDIQPSQPIDAIASANVPLDKPFQIADGVRPGVGTFKVLLPRQKNPAENGVYLTERRGLRRRRYLRRIDSHPGDVYRAKQGTVHAHTDYIQTTNNEFRLFMRPASYLSTPCRLTNGDEQLLATLTIHAEPHPSLIPPVEVQVNAADLARFRARLGLQ